MFHSKKGIINWKRESSGRRFENMNAPPLSKLFINNNFFLNIKYFFSEYNKIYFCLRSFWISVCLITRSKIKSWKRQWREKRHKEVQIISHLAGKMCTNYPRTNSVWAAWRLEVKNWNFVINCQASST